MAAQFRGQVLLFLLLVKWLFLATAYSLIPTTLTVQKPRLFEATLNIRLLTTLHFATLPTINTLNGKKLRKIVLLRSLMGLTRLKTAPS